MFLLVRSLTFEKFTDIGTDFVQVILYRVELHHGCLEHGLVQLHGVDTVILVLDFHFQTDTFGFQFCNLGGVVDMLYVQSTMTMILKYFITNSLSCSISYSIKSENASLIALSRVSAAALSRNP